MNRGLALFLIICLLATAFAGDIAPPPNSNNKKKYEGEMQLGRLTVEPIKLSPMTPAPTSIFDIFRRHFKNIKFVQSFKDDKSPIKCPSADKKNAHMGGGDKRRDSNYFLANNNKLAASCRLDCMSKVAGQVHFDGGCKRRFYYYGNTGRCLLASELDETQAKLAEAYCMACNGCVKTHSRPFNAAVIKGAVGDNSAKLPH